MIHFKGKNRRKTKQGYHNVISRWKGDIFSSKGETKRGIVSIKILKKRVFKKI